MSKVRQLFGKLPHAIGALLSSFALWTLWLGLVVLLGVQLYIASAQELEIPAFVLRQLESRLAESGVRATFGRTSFDPGGRVLIENVRLSLPAFSEPIVSARSVYLRLNPWFLIVGQVEPRQIQFTDVSASVPAMLSPTGRPEEIIRGLDATIEPRRRALVFQHLSGHAAGVAVSAHGILMLAPPTDRKPPLDAFAGFVANRFPALCRQALIVTEQVAQLEEPRLQLEFTPSESGAAIIHVLGLARAARFTKPLAIDATELRATTRLLLFGDAPPSDVELSAAELRLPNQTRVRGVHARVIGRIRTDDHRFELREITATADAASREGVEARAVSAQLFPKTLPRIEATLVADVLGAALAAQADGDVTTRSGVVRFDGNVSPRFLDVIGQRTGKNIRRFFDFESLTARRGEARFGANGTFEKLSAHVWIPRMKSYGVPMQDGRAVVELEPHRFHAPEAFARLGDNFARGSYEHDLKSHQYRFLLQGRLRPLDISGWFREWWPSFFQQLEFPATPPTASVDVRGAWRDGRQSNVFVFADTPKTTVRGTELDRVRTRLFIRPAFIDGLEIRATRDHAQANGRFTYMADPATNEWRSLDLALDSSLDLKLAGQLLGPSIAKTLEPFQLENPPAVKLRGQFFGPAAVNAGADDRLRIEARTRGEFRYHNFPLQDVSFVATLSRDEVLLSDIEAGLAGGTAVGHARVWGRDAQRKLGFNVAIDDASLGQVAAGLGEFFAAQKGQPPAPPGRFVQEKANVRFSLDAFAEGSYGNPFTYRGEGSAVLRGAELGEVPLLGALSELFRFTALRFTEARTNFKIEGARVAFPSVTLRGANSAIDAHGHYALDRRALDFNAKVFPFQESDSLLKSVVGVVLTPLSNALEVKLTGSLTKPEWAFVRGPTNLLRSIAPGTEPPNEATNASEKPPATPGTSP